MTAPSFVGLDVGGTTMKAGVVDDDGRVYTAVSMPTEAHRGQEFGLNRMADTILKAIAAAPVQLDQIAAIGVATPGTMDLRAGMILDPPNLKPWQNVPVRQYIQDRFHKPTAFQNDANAAALGEYWIGAGQGCHSIVLFTLGTGVGGGIVIGDMILEGEHSHGAELGHMKIEMTNPRKCGCGRLGCLEAYASATAVVKRAIEGLSVTSDSCLSSYASHLTDLTARAVFEAADAGDSFSDQIVEETAYYLAVGTTNVLHSIDPDMVVFGGGMTAAGDRFLRRIHKHVKSLAFPVPADKCQLRFAQLGQDAGFIGAAACGRMLFRKLQGNQVSGLYGFDMSRFRGHP